MKSITTVYKRIANSDDYRYSHFEHGHILKQRPNILLKLCYLNTNVFPIEVLENETSPTTT